MEALLRDIHYSFRTLFRTPWFSAAVLLTFALGIGASSATYSIISSLLLHPLSCEKPEELVLLDDAFLTLSGKDLSGKALDWKEHVQAFRDVGAYSTSNGGVNFGGIREPVRAEAAQVTANFFSLLGVSPALGRGFAPDEEDPGKCRVAVISYGLWERLFGSAPDVLGRVVSLNETSVTIVGVAPLGFQFPGRAELWIPISLDAQPILTSAGQGYAIVGRLKPGITQSQAQVDVDSFGARIRQAGLNFWPARRRIVITRLLDSVVGDYRLSMLVLTGAVGLVLLIACANVTNLLLTRAATRRKEIAVRASLGASRRALVRQMLLESVLLAVVGGSLGLFCAYWFLDSLVALRPPGLVALSKVTLDSKAISFTIAISLLAGVASGLAPVLHGLRMDVNDTLKESGPTIKAQGGNRFRELVVVSEIALALVLLVGAGLLIRSLIELRKEDPGFDAHNVITLSFDLPIGDKRASDFHIRLIESLKGIQGVLSVGAISSLPLSRGDAFLSLFDVGSRPAGVNLEDLFATSLVVTPDYFRTMGIPLLSGRFFTNQDVRGSTSVVIISGSLARRYWPNEDPVGKQLNVGTGGAREIVGVVADVKHDRLESKSLQAMYFPYSQFPLNLTTVVVRTESDPSKMIGAFREIARNLDSNLPLYDSMTMDKRLYESTLDRRFTALVLGVFAAIALILAAGGIHSIVAYSISQTTHEIGIRMALGAQRSQVLSLILRKALVLSLTGVGIGLASALVLTRLLSSLLYDLKANDPLTLTLTTGGLVCVALLASFLPAYGATKVDPAAVLRAQ